MFSAFDQRARRDGTALGAWGLTSKFALILCFLTVFSYDLPAQDTAPLIRSVSGTTLHLKVPMAAQPWAATLSPIVAPRQKQVEFFGQYPRFRRAKGAANARRLAAEKSRGGTLGHLKFSAGAAPLSSTTTTGAVVFDGPNELETGVIPPDSQVAAGPNSVVVVVNSLIAIYNKSGTLEIGMQQLSSFFGILNLTGKIYDPRIVYDAADQRFILSAADVDLTNFSSGFILLAVSATSDPTGFWYKYALNSMGRDASGTMSTFPDFPTLGLSSAAVYVSTGQFALSSTCEQDDTCSFSDTWIHAVGLAGLLAGSSSLSVTVFKNVRTASGTSAFAIEPAMTYGTAPAEFLVAADFNANPNAILDVFTLSLSGTPTLSVANLAVPKYSMPPDAVQPLALVPIATNDFRLLNAVWVNNSLWCAQNVYESSSNSSGARWYDISASALASIALAQTGDVTGAGDAYFPSMGVDSDNDVGMAFSTSSSTQYPSAAFTGRASVDAPNTMRPVSIYQLGTDDYSDFALRWGDYSGVSPDPGSAAFWAIAEYAGSPDPNFGTAIAEATSIPSLVFSPATLDFGSDPFNVPSVPMALTVTNVSASTATLGSAAIMGTNASDYSISADACSNAVLAPAQTCTLSLVFSPVNIGPCSAALAIGIIGALPEQVYLTGQGVAPTAGITVSPSALNFVGVPAHTTSAPQIVKVANTSSTAEALEISIGSNEVPFTETSNCGASLAAGQSCQVSVVYRPFRVSGSSIPDSSGLNVTYVGFPLVNPPMVALTGTAVAAPLVTICPTALNFGNQTVGTNSPAQTITVNNSGTSDLTIGGIAISGDFTETSTCGTLPVTIAAGNTCAISVTFSPGSAGTLTGALTISDNSAGSTPQVQLTGTGVASGAQLLPAFQKLLGRGGNEWRARLRARSLPVKFVPKSQLAEKHYGELPVSFEANDGQTSPRVKFLLRGNGYVLFLTGDQAVLKLANIKPRKGALRGESPGHTRPSRRSATAAVVRIALAGANPRARVTGLDELPGKVNYLIGNDPSKWKTSVPLYAKVRYQDVYPRTDLVYYGNHHRLEYDFVLAPGASPSGISLRVRGASGIHVAPNGDLVLTTREGDLRLAKPIVYQERTSAAGRQSPTMKGEQQSFIVNRKFVEGRFVLRPVHDSNSKVRIYEVGFHIAHYDHAKPLVIDPVLSYSTYLGGTSNDYANAIALDASGDAYVAGITGSPNFPVVNALQTALNKSLPYTSDAFVSELSPGGTSLVYSTYLGGSGSEEAQGIAVDSQGNTYVAGWTSSTDFPVTKGALQTLYKGSSPYGSTGFLAKIGPAGASLVYSTYFGGSGGDVITGLAIDASDDAYIAGSTRSPDLPTTPGAIQPSPLGGPFRCGNFQPYGLASFSCSDGFVAEVNPQGTGLVYGTYLGGSQADAVLGIAVDGTGSAYVTGVTSSYDFPTTPGAYQPWFSGYPVTTFVTKIEPNGTGLAYSTYFGPNYPGALGDEGTVEAGAIALDSQGAAYLVGGAGPNLPTVNPFETTPGYISSAFVAKLQPSGCGLSYSTYLGGSYSSTANAVAVDASGDAFVTGNTVDMDFPTLNPFQASYTQVPSGASLRDEAFIAELAPTGSSLIYSSYLGGSTTNLLPGYGGGDFGNAIAVDSAGNAYVAGRTDSTDFPIVNALESANGGSSDAFVTKVAPTVVSSITLSPTSLTFPDTALGTDSAPLPVTVTNTTSSPVSISSITMIDHNLFAVSSNSCTTALQPGASCTFEVIFTPPGGISLTTEESVAMVNDNAFAGPHHVLLFGTGIIPTGIKVLSNQTGSENFQSVPVGSSASQPVTVENTGSQSLTISSISTTGDYSETNNCTSALGYNSSCTVNITFSPGSSGTDDGTLTVTGSASNSPVTLTLTGTGEDFSIETTLGTPSSASVSPGQKATYSVSIVSTSGFNQDVSLTCTGAPAHSSCSISPASVTVPATVNVTVATTAGASIPELNKTDPPGFDLSGQSLKRWLLILVLVGGLIGWCILRGRGHGRAWMRIVMIMGILLLASCGGGGGGGGSSGVPGTPAGTYTLTVTATSGNLAHTTTLTLTVQ